MKPLCLFFLILVLLAPPAAAQEEQNPGVLMPADVELVAWLNLADLPSTAHRLSDITRRLAAGPISVSSGMVLQAAVEGVFGGVEIDYRRDVAPWVGDRIALGINDAAQALNGPALPEAVLTAPCRDRASALAMMQRVLAERKRMGIDMEERIYRGVPVYGEVGMAMALPGDHFVMGTPALVEAAIDRALRPAAPAFAHLVDALPPDAAAGLFWDASRAGWVGLSLRLQEDAVLLDVALAPGAFSFDAGALSGRVFQAVPGDALVVLAGHELPAWREVLEAGLSALRPLAADLNHRLVQEGYAGPSPTGLLRLAEHWPAWVEAFTGLDVGEDMLAWMQGEFALALTPLSPYVIEGHTSRVPFNVLAIAEVTDAARAEYASAHMLERLVELGLPVMTQTPHSMAMHVVRLAQHPRAYLGWAQTEAFAALGSGTWSVVRFLDTLHTQIYPMMENPRLARARARLGGAGHTMLFVDVQGGLPYLLRSLPDTSPARWALEENRLLLEAVESVTLSGRMAGKEVYTATLVVMFSE